MNRRGLVTIPKPIRSAFKGVFANQESISLDIKLLPNGTIVLVPIKKLPVSLFLQSDPELAQSIAMAYSKKNLIILHLRSK
jgi:hypothetical protein